MIGRRSSKWCHRTRTTSPFYLAFRVETSAHSVSHCPQFLRLYSFSTRSSKGGRAGRSSWAVLWTERRKMEMKSWFRTKNAGKPIKHTIHFSILGAVKFKSDVPGWRGGLGPPTRKKKWVWPTIKWFVDLLPEYRSDPKSDYSMRKPQSRPFVSRLDLLWSTKI